jgi:hypothetical protein
MSSRRARLPGQWFLGPLSRVLGRSGDDPGAGAAGCRRHWRGMLSEHALTNASRLWVDASLAQKQRFQSVTFPGGLRFDGGEFGTAVTCLAFRQLPESQGAENGVASPKGPGLDYHPVFQGKWVSDRKAA